MKQVIKDYFNFTRQERIGVLVVIVLLLFVFFLPKIISPKNKIEKMNTDTAWVNTMRKLEKKKPDSVDEPELNPSYVASQSENYRNDNTPASPDFKMFNFNPNALSAEGWKNLGIRDKTIHTIQNYLSKGGVFKKPEDLQKIYGLTKADYERLAPYVKIETSVENKSQEQSVDHELKKEDRTVYNHNQTIIEINTADTTVLIALPGIGSKLATRIISFRDKLGGFYSIEQIKETYGLQDSVFQRVKHYLKINNTLIKRININTVTLDELKSHPYFRYNIANPVILYRSEHGLFSKPEDIKKVMAITDEIYNKVAPYISVQ